MYTTEYSTGGIGTAQSTGGVSPEKRTGGIGLFWPLCFHLYRTVTENRSLVADLAENLTASSYSAFQAACNKIDLQ
jgi:hypothetical protein